jgi:hypothetical protein
MVAMPETHQPTSDAEKTTENAGQSTTAEEAMEAVAGVDGFVNESSYAPSGQEPEQESAADDDKDESEDDDKVDAT